MQEEAILGELKRTNEVTEKSDHYSLVGAFRQPLMISPLFLSSSHK